MTFEPTRQAGLDRLEAFLPRAGKAYAGTRNADTGPEQRTNVSMLSPWLHVGLIGEAEVLAAVSERHGADKADKFISEVFWRIYFKGYLEQRPTIWAAYKEQRDNALGHVGEDYRKAVDGETGIAAFDFWARELVETGYLHNHARMWFASIWIFTLKLDWTLGADFFLRHLADGDAASNTLSWRWVAGLHTKGKTYLARSSNIARYTEDHPQGPLAAEGLATDAPALTENVEHGRRTLALPEEQRLPEAPFALILHDEAASHAPLALDRRPALVIGVARPEARSPGEVGAIARDFAMQAVANGLASAGATFDCPTTVWKHGGSLGEILDEHGLDHVVMPYLPTGWTRDALATELDDAGKRAYWQRIVQPIDRATWPHARAGFFGVKKKMAAAMREAGVAGA